MAAIVPKKKRSEWSIAKARNSEVFRAIDSAVHQKSFEEEVGIETSKLFVGGSVGQGTAVTGHHDLDLVLFSHSIDFREVVRDGYDDLLTKTNAYLQRELSPNYTSPRITKVAIKFKYRLPEGGYLDVDLLLSPVWKSKWSLFHDLGAPKRRLLFIASFSEYQRDFIRQQTGQVRELIRRAKAWRDVSWPNSGDPGRPKSYLISLLVITAYHLVAGNASHINKKKARKVNTEMVKIVTEIAMNKNVNFIISGTGEDVTTSDLLPPCPRIIDPGNPCNNLYLSGVGPDPYGKGDGKWEMFKEKIPTIDLHQH